MAVHFYLTTDLYPIPAALKFAAALMEAIKWEYRLKSIVALKAVYFNFLYISRHSAGNTRSSILSVTQIDLYILYIYILSCPVLIFKLGINHAVHAQHP
jgi:hypothetical protein